MYWEWLMVPQKVRPDMKKRNLLTAVAITALAFALRPAIACGKAEIVAIVSHPVSDFKAWRKVFDAAQSHRIKAGVSHSEVFQDSVDPNKVIVIHRFPGTKAAEDFFGSEGHADTLKKGGATAPPVIMLAADAA